MKPPIEIFCCVAESDRIFLEKLNTQLGLQQKQGLISLWDKDQIIVGTNIDEEIKRHLDSARIFLLLIGPNFLADDYCYNLVMRTALEKYARGEAQTIPVIVSPANWQEAGTLNRLRVLPRNGEPVSRQPDPDDALREVAREVNRQVNREINAAIQKPGVSPVEIVGDPQGDSEPVPPRVPKSSVLLLVFLVCVLVGGLVFFISRSSNSSAGNTGATPVVTSVTSIARNLPSPTATHNDSASRLIPAGQQPVVNDPLKDNNGGYNWNTGTDPSGAGSCNFVQGQYLLTASGGSNGIGCNPESSTGIFSNFVYQIQMTILVGVDNDQSGAGLTFRVNPAGNGQQYQVSFDVKGNWQVSTDVKDLSGGICANPCSYFHTGLNQPNFITVRASGNSIQVQINGYDLGSYTDSTYSSGYIGVQLSSGTDNGSVEFSKVRVWKL